MSVYAIALVNIVDRDEYTKYVSGFMEVLAQHQGECLSVDDSPRIVEGHWPHSRTVLLKFQSGDAFQKWYQSDAYQVLARHRFKASTADLAVVTGLDGG
jgi:uncharacterized protein (DUF1330 family)